MRKGRKWKSPPSARQLSRQEVQRSLLCGSRHRRPPLLPPTHPPHLVRLALCQLLTSSMKVGVRPLCGSEENVMSRPTSHVFLGVHRFHTRLQTVLRQGAAYFPCCMKNPRFYRFSAKELNKPLDRSLHLELLLIAILKLISDRCRACWSNNPWQPHVADDPGGGAASHS